ncbi:uncharacterized protein LOC119631954 [Glossina fuscipes]|uniref:Uncharacterized protein LOC119631954 n=1 Tax=Glossina fuscipes TaxID=7396 RepID=A0A8U0W5M9_9MUSC|nr:uncharacterized protein LOC119631954 [Glossina fuscipes]XP_037880522.1 uncharacterized protein LOC119631954 [Glossina fuscipes]
MDQEEDRHFKLSNAETQESRTPAPPGFSQPSPEQRTVEAQTSSVLTGGPQTSSTGDTGLIIDKCPCSVMKMKKFSMKRLRPNGPCGRCKNTQRCESDDVS